MTKMWRNLISRCTLLLVGLAMMWGGYGCVEYAVHLHRDAAQYNARLPEHVRKPPSGAAVVGAVGLGLCSIGLVCSVAALFPYEQIEKLVRPRAPRTWENPEPGFPPRHF